MAEIQPNWSALYSNKGIRFGNNPGLDMLNRRYEQYQQQKQQDAQLFAQSMAKINFGGVKPVDAPPLQEKYSDILKTFSQMRATNDPKEYSRLSLELNQKKSQMGYDIARLQEENNSLQKAAEYGQHAPNTRDGWFNDWTKQYNTPTDSEGYQQSKSNLFNTMRDKSVDLNAVGDKFFKDNFTKRVNTGELKYDSKLDQYRIPKVTDYTADKDAIAKSWLSWANDNSNNGRLHQAMDNWGTSNVQDFIKTMTDSTWERNKNKLHIDVEVGAPHESETQKRENILLSKKYGRDFSVSQQPTPFRKTVDVLRGVMQTEGDESADKYLDVLTNSIDRTGLQGKITHSVKNGLVTIDVPGRLEGTTYKQPVRVQVNLHNDDSPSDMEEQMNKNGLNIAQYNQAYKGTDIPHNKTTQSGNTHFTVNGKAFNIPKNLIQQFKKQYPNAVEQ